MVLAYPRWFVQKLYEEDWHDIWCKAQYGHLFSLYFPIALFSWLNFIKEQPSSHVASLVIIQHYNAVCHLYIHEAPWCEGQGTSQSGVQTGPDQLPS